VPQFLSFLKYAIVVSSLLLSPFFTSSARSQASSADRFLDFAYGGGIAAGIAEFKTTSQSNPADGDAIFALGALQFFYALEGVQQDLYRYGAGNRAGGFGNRFFLPVFRIPVPPNPNTETADYAKVRGLLVRFVDRLQQAAATLAQLGDRPAKLAINPMKISFDIDMDGKSDKAENLAGILNALAARGDIGAGLTRDIAFDTADAKWLQGYSNVLMSIGNFFLSFDFEKSYNISFHPVFGNQATEFGRLLKNTKGDPEELAAIKAQIAQLEEEQKTAFTNEQKRRMRAIRSIRKKIRRDKSLSKAEKEAERAATDPEYKLLETAQRNSSGFGRELRQLRKRLSDLDPALAAQPGGMQSFLDPLSFLHSINWQVVEPDRLKQVRKNLLTVIKLNRETWRLVAAETDDDREWLPNPTQTSPFESLQVSQETIDAWLKTIDAAEAILEGRLLTPSIRFGRGVNMKRFFEEAETFDLILFLTGPNSIRYVEKGEIWDQRLMRTLGDPFGRNFGAYMFWFN